MISVSHRLIGQPRGIEVTPETIGADLIRSVGPGGYFMRQPHTLKYMRSEFFFPRVSDRELREDWEARGALDARQRANAIAREILDEHRPEPLPPGTEAEIRAQFDLVLPDSP